MNHNIKKYTVAFHMKKFAEMAEVLHGDTNQVVVSFLDLYEKTKKNFPQGRSVTSLEQEALIDSFSQTAAKYNLQIHLLKVQFLHLQQLNIFSQTL